MDKKLEINKDLLKQQWLLYFEKEELEKTETVKLLVILPKINEKTGKNVTWVEKQQISSYNKLEEVIDTYIERNGKCGFALSTGVYKNVENESPNNSDFLYTNCIALDFDAVKGDDRVSVYGLGDDILTLHKLHLEASVAHRLGQKGISTPRSQMALVTGGGFLLIYKFNHSLSARDAKNVYENIKNTLIPNKNFVLETYKGVDDVDFTGEDYEIGYLFDRSAFDITHAERMAGTNNIKYDYIVKNISSTTIPHIKPKNGAISDEGKYLKKIIKSIESVEFDIDVKTLDADEIKRIDIIDTVVHSGLGAKTNPNILAINNSISNPKTVLEKILNIKFVTSNPRYSMFCSPLKPERHPSVSLLHEKQGNIYKNIIYDFHQGETYDLISYIVKVKQHNGDVNYNKTRAINEIQRYSDISKATKQIAQVETEQQSADLVAEVDTENFLYYVLANKKTNAVILDLRTGVKRTYDGLQIMLESVLRNQLNIQRLNPTLIKEFKSAFEEHILKIGFERFMPGKEAVLIENATLYINTWVPNEFYLSTYKNALVESDQIEKLENKELAETKPRDLERDLEISDIISMIEEKTPYCNIFLHQIVQEGDLEYFVNWLGVISDYNILPTFPVLFNIQGAGKGVFVEEILSPYFNAEYVKVIDSSRIQNNFNSVLSDSSLVVLDEVKINNHNDYNTLKLLTGNSRVQIERKGQDVTTQERQFNFIVNSNEDVPISHLSSDRRIWYNHQTIPLTKTLNHINLTVDDFLEKIREEILDFWSIIVRLKYNKQKNMVAHHGNIFNRQVLMQHPLGKLVATIISNDWDSLALEISAKETKQSEYLSKLRVYMTVKEQFEATGSIDILSLNNYISAVSDKKFQSIKTFIEQNNLLENGFKIIQEKDEDYGLKLSVSLDVERIKESITTRNILFDLFPDLE